MTTALPSTSPEGFKISGYIQENTTGVRCAKLGELCLPSRPNSSNDTATVDQYRKLLRTAQQIIFLPFFTATDHIFYGEINTLTADQGYPSVRTGLVNGSNFRMHISTNYNFRYTSLNLDMEDTRLRTQIQPDERELDNATVEWLTEHVLIPVRDEVMLLPIDLDDY